MNENTQARGGSVTPVEQNVPYCVHDRPYNLCPMCSSIRRK
jgi:hypothetical protein